MRILTVRQPWAWAIIHGQKDVENRVRNIAGSYRGPVAIHAGAHFDFKNPSDRMLAYYARQPVSGRDTGAIIGVVEVIDVHHADWCWDMDGFHRVSHCSTWAESDVYHLQLANPRPLVAPIPFKGALGLRTLDAETTARVLAGLAS